MEEVEVVRNYRENTHLVCCEFRDKEMVQHFCARVKENKALWFNQGVSKEVIEDRDNRYHLDILVRCLGVRGRNFDERDIPRVLTKILRGDTSKVSQDQSRRSSDRRESLQVQ